MLGGVVRIAAAWALNVYTRCSGAQAGLALCYHRVADAGGDPERELTAAIATRDFRCHMSRLRRRYRVVPASQLRAAAAARSRWQRLPVAVTFDDDMPSHVKLSAPILRELGMPATVFLTGAGLGDGRPFWWESLERAWNRGLVDGPLLVRWGLPPAGPSLREVARHVQAMPPGARAAVAAELLARVGADHARPLSAGDMRALVRAGLEVGFHTRDHHDMTCLTDDELAAGMRDGRRELAAVVGPVTIIAYPHGRADARVAAAAEGAGYAAGFVADGAAITPASDPHLLGRRYPARGGRGRFELDVARTLAAPARRRA